MSNQEAKSDAERIYAELRKLHPAGYIGMIADNIKRLVSRDMSPKKRQMAPKPK